MRAPWLPAEALARWRAGAAEATDPVARVVAWWDLLAARMTCSGGRLARLLVDTGQCALAELAACAAAQLAAGPVPDNALYHDVSADLDALVERAPVDELPALSAAIAGCAWLVGVDDLHAEIAGRLLAAGRADEVDAIRERIRWHTPLLDLLERHAPRMGPEARAATVAAAARAIRETHLPADYHVELWVQLAAATGERRWLARAQEALAGLPEASRVATPDREHPVVTLAWGLARLGEFAEALARVATLPPHDRWLAHTRLLPLAPAEARAGVVAAMVAAVGPLELAWAWVVEAAPETGGHALRAIAAVADEDERFEQLAAVAWHLRGADARAACEALLAGVVGLAPGSPRWSGRWERVLDALTATECEALLLPAARRALIDELLARPELDLWAEAGPFVPEDRVTAVLERSYAGLLAADHYRTRDAWIAVGLPLLARVAAPAAERWLALAATQLPRTAVEERPLAWFAPWTEAQRRAIVAGRLAQHQHEFLPRQLIAPWLVALAWALPPRLWPDWGGAVDADALARARAAAVELTVAPAAADEVAGLERALVRLTSSEWPTHEHVAWVIAVLGRLAGEAAITAAAAALVGLLRRLSAAP